MKKFLKNNDYKTYLGKRGYIIRKKFFDKDFLNNMRNELNVKPNVCTTYNDKIVRFKVYMENKNKMYIPKCYGIKKIGIPENDKIPPGLDINIDFIFTLRDEQQKPVKAALKAYKENGGGILHLQCGFGKTIIALYLISILKKKTLVIVHKDFLLNQWIERIKSCLPDARIGIIQGNKFDIEDKDIVIGMLQTIWQRKFSLDAFDSFGHIVIDECHRIPSEKFSKALQKINSKYMLGLSATPTRTDGLTKILKWYIGDIFFSMKVKNINEVQVERLIIRSENNDYKNELIDFRGRVKISTMINNICYYLIRSYAIIKMIKDTITKDNNRQILLLSDRKKQLEDIFNIVSQKDICTVGYYVGGMKKNKLQESESKQLILGTYSMAKEGLDIKSLNCLILASPKSDIIQSIGRILRQKHEDIIPKIIDIVDNFSVFKNQAIKRFKVFKKRKYKIKDIILDLDEQKIISTKEYNFEEKEKKKKVNNTGYLFSK